MIKKQNKLYSLGIKTITEIKEMSNILACSETMVIRLATALLYQKIKNNFEEVETLKLLKND